MNSAKLSTIFIGILVVIICLLTSIRYLHSYTEVDGIRNLILGIASLGIAFGWAWIVLGGQMMFSHPTILSLILGLVLLSFTFFNYRLMTDIITKWSDHGFSTVYDTPWLIPDVFKAIFLPLFTSILLLLFFLNSSTIFTWISLGTFSTADWILRIHDFLIGAPGTRGIGHWLDFSIETVVIIATVYYFYSYRKF